MTERAEGGALAVNVMHFARVLRRAGMPIGTGKVLAAVEALAAIDPTRRQDMFWALHAVFVERHAQSELFKLAFDRFWIVRSGEEDGFLDLDAMADNHQPQTADPLPRRLADALADAGIGKTRERASEEKDVDSSATWSAAEQLRSKDFESMSADELALARRIISHLRLPIPTVPNRRFKPHAAGRRIDMRATLRNTVRAGGAIDLKRKKRIRRHPPLVVLCDISGSMAAYSRMLLHFLHGVTNDRDRVHTFLFGTRLTNISRQLAHSDPDVALRRVGDAVQDWSGGTRIGQTLGEFNRRWSRRVLGQGAVVLLITDGLDRDGGEGLEEEVERLQRSCRRLIWLNPLLRFDGFEPKSAGIRAILPHVDDFLAAHNLESLEDLANAFAPLESARRWPLPQSSLNQDEAS